MIPARRLILCAVLALAGVPTTGAADGFMTRDLGTGGDPGQCLDRAERAMNDWFRTNGVTGGLVQRGDWSVQGYDLPPGNVQVQIACPWRNDQVLVALMFSYSTGPESDRVAVIDGLDAIWHRLAAQPLQKWAPLQK
jgi:hypothetical protein